MNNDNKRVLNLEKGVNFRELGGYKTVDDKTIKYHKVIRSAGLSDLTANDLNFLNDYGLKFDVDFRSQEEIDNKPDKLPKNAEYVQASVFEADETEASKVQSKSFIPEIGGDPTDGFEHMKDVYRDIITGQQAKSAYRTFFDKLLTNDQDDNVLLFHCSAGKDRTGMGAVYLLSALGVPMDVIKQDYLLTNQANKQFVDNLIKTLQSKGYTDKNILSSVRDLMTVHTDYLAAAEKEIAELSGNIDNYIKDELKVTPSEIRDLRAIYLD
jgi:protein-tyrosine phosphatase